MAKLTKDILETYQTCNPQFKYSEELNPKRFLTSPSVGVLNDGHDNANSDLILSVNLALVNLESQQRFEMFTLLLSCCFVCLILDSIILVMFFLFTIEGEFYYTEGKWNKEVQSKDTDS